ncbi:MAG: NAD-dependent epimerase/dehydratase family protein, partial [bacterium]|nr:NAD-dependent epimerase/dehydratase family protein [bacterium]
MIIVTGGAGFIGSNIVAALNQCGRDDIIVVDCLGADAKWNNLVGLSFADYLEKDDFLEIITEDKADLGFDVILHMGACSSTTEMDASFLIKNNFEYTKILAEWCVENDVHFIYASSGATYGDGSQGFSDDHDKLDELRPLNMYGYSKHLFDLWAKR